MVSSNNNLSTNSEKPYEPIFDAQGNNYPVLQNIWSSVYGDDYPEDADPTNFVTLTDLKRIVDSLPTSLSRPIVDLGCGRGKFTVWLAQQVKARFIGIDLFEEAISYAQSFSRSKGLDEVVHFQQGLFEESKLPSSSCDAAISTDALMFASDRFAALQETARILTPGAPFIFTSWEMTHPSPSLKLDAISDYSPLLKEAGFDIEVYEEIPNWKQRQRAILSGILEAKDALVRDIGEAGAMHLCRWALERPKELDYNRRIFVVARLLH